MFSNIVIIICLLICVNSLCITPISYNIKCYCNNDLIYLCNWLWESICDGYRPCMRYCLNYYKYGRSLNITLVGCKTDMLEGLRLRVLKYLEKVIKPWNL